jgi:hypothetical protein
MTTKLTEGQWIRQLLLRTLRDVSTTMVAWLPPPPLCPPQTLPTWGTLFILLIHLVPWGSFIDGALTTTTMTITMMRIKLTRTTFPSSQCIQFINEDDKVGGISRSSNYYLFILSRQITSQFSCTHLLNCFKRVVLGTNV